MEFEAIKTDRLYVKVADRITSMIGAGQIKSGDRLPSERDLAERLGVSRPTIREAMIALELSGIIEIRTGSGIYITEKKPVLKTSDRGIGPFDILKAREVVEVQVCGLAATHISDEQIDELRVVLEEIKEELRSGDVGAPADRKFHCAIAKASRNVALYTIVDWLWELRNQSTLSTAFLDIRREENVQSFIDEHQRIIDALEKRDPDAAKKAMQEHIKNMAANHIEG